MKPLRQFSEFLKQGTVKTISPDFNRAGSLAEDAERRRAFLKKVERGIGITDDNANYFVEAAYDVLLPLIRAKLLADGYSTSGEGAHEAEVSYMRELGLPEADTSFMNALRYHRNGIKYYGKRFDREYAGKVMRFMGKMYPLLKRLVTLPAK